MGYGGGATGKAARATPWKALFTRLPSDAYIQYSVNTRCLRESPVYTCIIMITLKNIKFGIGEQFSEVVK